MAHIQRRCPSCAIAVPKGRKSCARCGGTTFTYRVRYLDPDGVEKSKSFRRKADADDFETSVEHNLRARSYVDPAAGRQSVKAYLEEWRQAQAQHRSKTADSTMRRFRTMVYPHIGDVPIGKLGPSRIRSWQATLTASGVYAASTIAGVRGQLAGAFNDAVEDRRIASNPFAGVKGPKPFRNKIVPRTVEQVEAGRAAIKNDQYRRVIRVDAGSGLRWSELFGLTVDRVDFLRKTIRVDRQLVGRRGGVPIFGPPKTDASEREIPVGDLVIREIAAHLAKYPAVPGEGWFAESGGTNLRPIQHAGLIFTTMRGTPMVREVWINIWNPAREAMGLGPREGLHQLRHFFASLLIADGRNPKEVQALLGHASMRETMDTYAHLWPDSLTGARTAIDAAFDKQLNPPGEGVGETGSEGL